MYIVTIPTKSNHQAKSRLEQPFLKCLSRGAKTFLALKPKDEKKPNYFLKIKFNQKYYLLKSKIFFLQIFKVNMKDIFQIYHPHKLK
jgi:hypothetical protein